MAVDATGAASGLTLAAVLRRSERVFADRPAIVTGEAQLTYRELGARSDRLANALLTRGVGPGGRIGVLSPPRPEFVECYVAAAKLGVTVVALNTRLHPREIAYCVRLCAPQLLFCTADLRDALGDDTDPIVFGGGYDAFLAGGADGPPAAPAPAPEAIHNVLFTSGTTGRPKGAMISQRAAATRAIRLAQWFALTPEDGFVGWLPLFHCGGDESLYATLMTGGRYAPFQSPDVEAMFAAIERRRLSWTLLLPGVITDFLSHPRRSTYDLSSLRFAIGYANMMPQVVREFTASLGDFYDAYGQTESSYLLAHGHVARGASPTLRKQPAPLLDVAIVDDDLHEQPVGVPGECVVRGPSVMSGYIGDPEATAAAFAGGWLHTGDVLVRNDDGTLTYVDRKKYLIKTGGENVYPAEVEQTIAADPAVQEVCAVGVPDVYWGEAIKAIVVLLPGAKLTRTDIVARCRASLAGYKRPRYIQFMRPDELPRSTTGKLLRHELAAQPATDEQRVD